MVSLYLLSTHWPNIFVFFLIQILISLYLYSYFLVFVFIFLCISIHISLYLYFLVFATVVSRPPTLQPLTGLAGVLKRPATDQQTIEYRIQDTEYMIQEKLKVFILIELYVSKGTPLQNKNVYFQALPESA